MPPDGDSKAKPKHRKSTCAGCRRRKSKCDGKTPKCTTSAQWQFSPHGKELTCIRCIAYKDECHYDKPPSLAYVRSLEEEIQELKSQLRQIKTQVWLAKTAHAEEKKRPSPSPVSDAGPSHHSGSLHSLAHRNRHINWETVLSVDDSGGIAFHNSTSAVHEPPPNGTPAHHAASSHSSPKDDQLVKRDLVLNASHQRQIEHYAIANSAVKINVPKEVSIELLNYHWCWVHPMFLFVYRPAFIRCMAMVDYSSPEDQELPYFSDTLIKAMHAHSARFLNHDVYQHQYHTSANSQTATPVNFSAGDFMQRMTDEARYGLGMDILKPSGIPTIQALLQQSAREVVFGHASQAWTFAGVAFRMALDMGIHLPSEKLSAYVKTLTAEDIEIRKRLFWSCYTWDKILSLYLGRMPGFTHPSTDDIPLSFMDDYSDTDLWVPYYGETPKPDHSHASKYPPCPGHVVSCFRQLCKLCVILNDLMQDIYSPEAAARREEDESPAEAKAANEGPLLRISRDLRDWLVCLPKHLRISPDQLPPLAPPAHIVSLNLLYHTTVILLYRPVILGTRDMNLVGPSKAFQICVQATAAIHDLLILQSNTFGLSIISYLNVYSAYIAATVAVLRYERDFRVGEDYTSLAKRTGLSFLLDVLDRSATSMPGFARSSSIIRKRMRAVSDQQMDECVQIPLNSTQSYGRSAIHAMDHTTQSNFQRVPDQAKPSTYSHPDVNGGFVAPMQWQSGLRSSLYSEPSSIMDEYLPAFPGQRFPVGSEHSFGSSEVDSQARSALMGYNLDPHPRLNAGDINWQLMETFEGNTAQIHTM